MAGKVWLVGAGPSDVGLFTIKGREVLEQAEVVVYDALVGAGIMTLIPANAERINVGKRANHHIMQQEDINKLLLEKALEGKRVVRLKGGDPFMFGRGGEELELLCENGIEYEIVPGVTSPVSVPAYCGIPVTHRDFCSSIHIITGHQKKDEPLHINFNALKETQGTLVFLMGLSAVGNICKGLLDCGMEPTMPAAVLQKGTTSEQRALVADIATLPQKVKEEKIQSPAIIVVGKVCALREKFAWYEKLPLFGCRVAVTRPKDRSTTLSDRLRSLGAQVIEMPCIRTVAREMNDEIKAVLDNVEAYNYLAFTSPAGVSTFMNLLLANGKDARALSGCEISVLGSGTGAELKKYGILPDSKPDTYDGLHLGQTLASKLKSGDKVLIPRAAAGNPQLVEELKKVSGIEVTDLPIYDTVYEEVTVDIEKEFTEHDTVAVFTSASTVKGFANAAGALDLKNVTALCIGKQTAQQAEAFGMKIYIAEKATIASLTDLVIRYNGEREQ